MPLESLMDSFQNSPAPDSTHQDVIQEYEVTIQHLQTQNYTLKSRLAVAEDTLRRKLEEQDCSRDRRTELKYEMEIQELSTAIRTYESEQSKLQEERKYWENKAKALEQKYAQCLEDVEELDAFNATTQLSVQAKSDLLSRAEADINHYRQKCEALTSEVARLTERTQNFEALQTQITSFKSQLNDLETVIQKKDELLKAAGKRFAMTQKRVEILEKENIMSVKTAANLEQEKRRLSEKLQTVSQRAKGDEKAKGRIKELEDLVAQYRVTAEQSNCIVAEWERRVKDLEISLTSSTETIRKLKIQLKLLTSEKDNLATMNEQLSVQLHRFEEEEADRKQRKSGQPICDITNLQGKMKSKDEELAGRKLGGTCRSDLLSSLFRSVNRDEDLRRELERKDEVLHHLRTQCAQLTNKLEQGEVYDVRVAQAYELAPSENASPQQSQKHSQSKRMRSTSHGVTPLDDSKDPSRSKTPTPSQANTTRRCSNPPSPVLSRAESKTPNDETPKYPVQEVVIGLNSSHSKFRLSRRTTSERQPWKK